MNAQTPSFLSFWKPGSLTLAWKMIVSLPSAIYLSSGQGHTLVSNRREILASLHWLQC
jgi:hypothetical protein